MAYSLPSDPRYTVTQEWTGHEKPQFVVRFCGEWISSRQFRGSAIMLASGERVRRDGALTVEAIT
tara:strand:+ start:3363 stop:3557 length:195 start_codon:yes stop_codon:yes gene_type:complete